MPEIRLLATEIVKQYGVGMRYGLLVEIKGLYSDTELLFPKQNFC